MARNTKRGKCELCGEVANVGTNHGSATCPKCTHVQAALANRLQAVAKAARAMGKAEDLIKALIPDAGSLAVQVTATLLQEISGIVGYDGENPAELVEAVRRMALREASSDCQECADLKGDLLMACELDLDLGKAQEWDYVVAAAIQTIAALENRNIFLAQRREDLLVSLTAATQEATHLRAKLREALDDNASLVGENSRVENVMGTGESQLAKLRAELAVAQQARLNDSFTLAVQAEANVADQAAELNRLENAPRRTDTTYLLDIALKALRGEGPDADQLATLLDAARRAA